MSRGTTDWNQIRDAHKTELAVWLANRVLVKYTPDLSITQLSGITGVSGTALWRYVMQGNRASEATIRRIAKVLGDLDGGLVAGGYAPTCAEAAGGHMASIRTSDSVPEMVEVFNRLMAFADITRLDSADQRRMREHLDLLLGQPKYQSQPKYHETTE